MIKARYFYLYKLIVRCRFFIAKYNTLFKQQVIEFYIQNGKNYSLIRKHFQLDSRTLRHWINQFNHSRINGLAVLGKKRNYSLKLNVIQTVKNGMYYGERFERFEELEKTFHEYIHYYTMRAFMGY